MRTGKLAIGRGHQFDQPAVPAPRLSIVGGGGGDAVPAPRAASHPPAEVTAEYKPVHDRLGALERLAKLRELGILTEDEFVEEKAYILGRHAEELILNEPLLAAPAPERGPSLLGRLRSWKFVPVGIVAGIALSYASQPAETMRFFDEALRLIGA
jgi:hypothetical protein